MKALPRTAAKGFFRFSLVFFCFSLGLLLPHVSFAGGYVLDKIELYDLQQVSTWVLMDQLEENWSEHTGGGDYLIRDTVRSCNPSGEFHINIQSQNPSPPLDATMSDWHFAWSAFPTVLAPGDTISESITATVSNEGWASHDPSYDQEMSVSLTIVAPPDITTGPSFYLIGGLGTATQSAPFSFTIPPPTPYNSTIQVAAFAAAYQKLWGFGTLIRARQYLYYYSWSDGVNLGRSNFGGPSANRFTHFDGPKGVGICSRMGLPAYQVNTANLNLVIEDSDFSYEGLGPAIKMTRTYNADATLSGIFGPGWAFAYESRIVTEGATAFVRKGSGQAVGYYAPLWKAWPGSAVEAEAPSGVFDSLTWTGNTWAFEDKNTHLIHRYILDPTVAQSNEYRLYAIDDRDGKRVKLLYNGNGTIRSVTDAAGRATVFTYNAQKLCTAMTTPDGRKALYHYDASGNLIETVDLLGTVSDYTFDAEHYLTKMTVSGASTSFGYVARLSGQGKRIGSVTDAEGKVTLYDASLAQSGETTVIVTNPRGSKTTYLSSGGLTTSITDPLGKAAITVFNSERLPTSLTDRSGNVTLMEYDARGNLLKLTDPVGNFTAYAWDANDNLTKMTDAAGKAWRYSYDNKGRPIKATSPLGKITTFGYDAKGQLTSVVDPASRTVTMTHDAFGNVTSISDPAGDTQLVYDAIGMDLVSVTKPGGLTTLYEHDANGRITKETFPGGKSRAYTYDCCSQMSVTDENGHVTEVARDGLLFARSLTDAAGSITHFSHDGEGNLTKVTDPRGKPTTFAYDGANRKIRTTDATQGFSRFLYDTRGNLTQIRDQRDSSTFFAYDRNDRLVVARDSLGNRVKISRDKLGRVGTITNARGGKTANSYDADGHLVRRTFNAANPVTFSYDRSGYLISFEDGLGVTGYTRDASGRVTGIQYPDGLSVAFTYNTAGNLGTVTYPGALHAKYGYDIRNRVNALSFAGNTFSATWDPVGNLLSETRSNGTRTTYAYNEKDIPTLITHLKGASAFAQLTYKYDAAGNVAEESGQRPLSPTLSASARLASYNTANQLLSSGPESFAYDKDGNLTTISGARSLSASYDPANRPTSLTLGGAQTGFTYDALGQRVKSGAFTHHYDHAGRLLFSTNDARQVIATYFYAGDRLVATRDGGGHVYFYHYDRLGSTLALTGAAGNIATAYAYLPFGAVSRRSGSVYNPFTFMGAYGVMEESGQIYFMKNRYYDALAGRFLQNDPLGFWGGLNLYAYAGNNPVTNSDPDGLIQASGSKDWAAPYNAPNAYANERCIIPRTQRVNPVDKYVDKAAFAVADILIKRASVAYKLVMWGVSAYNYRQVIMDTAVTVANNIANDIKNPPPPTGIYFRPSGTPPIGVQR